MAQERRQKMGKRRFKAEEIIMKMREVEVHQGKGMDLISACKQAGITDLAYYRWRKKYGGMKIDQARKYKEMEKENARLKKLVADQALDISILKEAARENF
jgi:spore maturation protein CgeB